MILKDIGKNSPGVIRNIIFAHLIVFFFQRREKKRKENKCRGYPQLSEKFLFRLFSFLSFLLIFFIFDLFSQQITSPSSRDIVKACADYAEDVLHDRWDMNERTDLGWRIFNVVEQAPSYLTDISFSGGLFSARSVLTSLPDYSDVNISILDSAYLGAAPIGKFGINYPIDANKYKVFALRMYLEPDSEGRVGQLFWSKNTVYNGITCSGLFQVYNGWAIYIVDIPSLGIMAGSDPWSGLIDSLRFDPIVKAGKLIQIDWIRLVENDSSGLRTIRWSGFSGNVDIYLDNDKNPGNGNLGLLAKNVSGTSYSFLAGALAAGYYYVAIAPTGTNNLVYSPGYYYVNEVPIINFTKPSEKGSDEDFITVFFSDPWDMANSEDIDYFVNLRNPQFTTINYEDLAGRVFTNQTVFMAESTVVSPPQVGDPQVFFLHFLRRGKIATINANKYHNLVFKMGISGAHSTAEGSIARVIWKNKAESVENVSQDIVIRHLPDRWIMHEVVCDLKTLPLEEGAGSPSHSGWTGEIDCFRIDPHEFADGRAFFFDEVRLTSDWQADSSFDIRWVASDSDSQATISLYYDTDNINYDGKLIAEGIPASSGFYVWNTASIPDGKYWIYAIISDGINQTKKYAGGPLLINHGGIPIIKLSRQDIFFGAEQNGASTSAEKVLITNSGSGVLNWQVRTNVDWLEMIPNSGTGNGSVTISIKRTNISPGVYRAFIWVEDANASNSPQIINVTLTVYGAGQDGEPFGCFDTPLEGAHVFGSVPVTGWALDDIEVVRVEIKRTAHPLDDPVVVGADGLVYIGDGVFVRGARPDVASLYSGYPRADRAGWGYMMLTNFLPNQGNGVFTLYVFAYDTSGHRKLLGAKTIYCDNASATLPFGTIDTPGQGAVVSGSNYVNFGWALTPRPKYIPRDGSTIWVWIDSQPVGHPVYNQYRADIAGLFPGYANSDGAVGYYYIDTTRLENGTHTIVWGVTDSAGETSGIGSRYFEVENVGVGLGKRFEGMRYEEDRSGGLRLEVEGGKEVEVEELGMVEVRLRGRGGSRCIGWGEEEGEPLPVGSSLDEARGVFRWIVGPGFLGRHVLHFAVTDGQKRSPAVKIIINIVPKRFLSSSKQAVKKSINN
jgi:hypothetical protein